MNHMKNLSRLVYVAQYFSYPQYTKLHLPLPIHYLHKVGPRAGKNYATPGVVQNYSIIKDSLTSSGAFTSRESVARSSGVFNPMPLFGCSV